MKGFKYQRVTAGLTQADVAKYLGMSQANYSRIEGGYSEFKMSQLVKLAKFYKVSVEDLL